MNTLRPDLFTIDFEQLVTLGRSMLPKHAPDWTDHNLHDPGITLIELLAWTAEAQIYSLARLRTDERWAFGALFGLHPRGPLPAMGFVLPAAGVVFPARGVLLPPGVAVTVDHGEAPGFRVARAINLTGAALVGVETRLRDGSVEDHTRANASPGAGYDPFGDEARPGDRLALTFSGPLLAPDGMRDAGGTRRAQDACLALGVIVPATTMAHAGATTPGAPAAASPCVRTAAAPLAATLLDGVTRHPLPVEFDGTLGFLRSGVLLLGLGALGRALPERVTIEITSRGAGLAGAPRVLQIVPNALPIEQQRTVAASLERGGASLPNEHYVLADVGIRFGDGAPPLHVETADTRGVTVWSPIDDLARAGPRDRVFCFDAANRRITFGNGVNGMRVPGDAGLRVRYEAADGAAGNLGAGMRWRVGGAPGLPGSGIYGVNPLPVSGGADGLDLDGLRRLARVRAREAHALVTSHDLESAALALTDLRVARASALPAPDPGGKAGVRQAPLLDTRTLVAVRERTTGHDSPRAPEQPRWLAAIQRALAPCLPLGERLRVVAPDYLPLAVVANLRAQPGYAPDELARHALDALADHFAVVRDDGSGWPLGAAVSVLAIRAKLLGLEGVAAVMACTLLWGAPPVAEAPRPSRTFLPLFSAGASRVVVERVHQGAIR
jgi:hypothetical protein